MDAEREAPAFKRVGTYDLYSCIGQGSFATVYRGQHRTTKRVVAVKAIVRARLNQNCLLYTSPSPRDRTRSRMPSSA